MLAHFDKIVRVDFRINTQLPLMVGVSGGADSLCLLDLLVKNDYAVIVAHVDHKLRPESGEDARRVALLADSLGLEFVSREVDIQSLAEESGLSIEQAARQARYDFLFDRADKYGAQAVVVGHNADDQVETLLMHFLQGAGLDGMVGMLPRTLPNPWSGDIPLLRPLLGVWRTDILEYCQANQIEPLFDPSNQNTDFFRNRIRHELLPMLDDYAPGIRNRMHSMAEVFRAEREFLDDALEVALGSILQDQGEGYLAFDLDLLRGQTLAIQRRLIRWGMGQLRSDTRELDFEAVERALSLLDQSAARQRDIAAGVRAFIEDDRLFLAGWEAKLPSQGWPQLPEQVSGFDIVPPTEVELAEGWCLRAKTLTISDSLWEQIQTNRDPLRAWLDLGEQAPALNCRIRRPGDYLVPLGLAGKSKKISHLMIDKKIPQRARQRWPLICFGEDVVWLPGVQQAEGARVTPESQQIVFLQLIPPRRS